MMHNIGTNVLDGSLTVGPQLNPDECDTSGYQWLRFGSPSEALLALVEQERWRQLKDERNLETTGGSLMPPPTSASFNAAPLPNFRIASINFGTIEDDEDLGPPPPIEFHKTRRAVLSEGLLAIVLGRDEARRLALQLARPYDVRDSGGGAWFTVDCRWKGKLPPLHIHLLDHVADDGGGDGTTTAGSGTKAAETGGSGEKGVHLILTEYVVGKFVRF